MLKKFLNDESKSPVIDFLLWLVVYPFVIVFAVACVAFIFSFSVFREVKITDWITALSTMFFTGGLLIVTARAAKSWKEQKIPDLKSVIARNIIDFDTYAILITVKKFTTMHEILEYHSFLLKKYWDIEHSLSTLYMFDRTNKQEIDTLFSDLLAEINNTTDLINEYARRYLEIERIEEIEKVKEIIEKIEELVDEVVNSNKKLLPITKDLFKLVVGKDNVVGYGSS